MQGKYVSPAEMRFWRNEVCYQLVLVLFMTFIVSGWIWIRIREPENTNAMITASVVAIALVFRIWLWIRARRMQRERAHIYRTQKDEDV